MNPERMLRLMAYADGELDDAERQEVESWIASDPAAAEFVGQVNRLGDTVRETWQARTPALASFDVTSAVMEKVAQSDHVPSVRGVRIPPDVVSLEAARSKRMNRLKVGSMVAGALALAASMFLVIHHASDEAPLTSGFAMIKANDPVEETAEAKEPVEVRAIQSEGQSVSVFQIPGADDLSTSVVIWVDEQPGDN